MGLSCKSHVAINDKKVKPTLQMYEEDLEHLYLDIFSNNISNPLRADTRTNENDKLDIFSKINRSYELGKYLNV